mgnify:CR=1 FL=1
MKPGEVTVTGSFEFDVAHYLESHEGKCRGIHGHRYKLEITLGGEIDPDTFMIIDSYKFKEIVNKLVINRLDHGGPEGQTLNDIMGCTDPTVEFMVGWIFDAIGNSLPVKRIRLWETPNFYAEMNVEW